MSPFWYGCPPFGGLARDAARRGRCPRGAGMPMFQVLILLCSATLSPPHCQPHTALEVINGPEAQNEVMCGLHGQAFAAQHAMSHPLHEGEYFKLVCTR